MIPGKPIYHAVFNKCKMIFTLIPKNANTSIKYALLETFSDLENDELDKLKQLNIDRFHSSTLKFFNFISNNELERFDEYVKLCFVRNPFDRLVSGWENKIKPLENKKRFGFNGQTSFPNFIKQICKTEDYLLNRHFIPQINFLKCNNKIQKYNIMKYEFLESEWTDLQNYLDMRCQIVLSNLPKLNYSKNDKLYKDYYNKELINLVKDKFKEDLEYFEYDF
ncbi:sulfotransferase family protein [Candidatus Pacearchaeota archaeon]|nr:sulfotransferase family protein [Candidatus Pacearchaeota archaeon]